MAEQGNSEGASCLRTGWYWAVLAIIVVQARYHFPSSPSIAVLAGFTISQALLFVSRQLAFNKDGSNS
jgi:hypothetical protein